MGSYKELGDLRTLSMPTISNLRQMKSPWVSRPLSRWCHPPISSSVIPFSCLQSFPASGSFLMSWLFSSGGQSIEASVSVLPINIQSWFPLGLTGLISLQSKGLSRVFYNTTVQKASVLQCSAFIMVQLSHPYMTTGKNSFTIQTFVNKVMSLLFNMLSRFVMYGDHLIWFIYFADDNI